MSITSANAILMLSVSGLFSAPQQLQGFATDDMYDAEDLEVGQVMMGIDGKLSAGFVFNEVTWGVTLQADSDSNGLFDQWYAAERVAKEKLRADGQVKLLATGQKWIMTKGYLTNWKPMPPGQKTLKPRKFSMKWESVIPSNA